MNVAPLGGSIQRALELSFGRNVRFSKAHFALLPIPGFSLEDVTIEEDPHYGLEPFAYVSTLHARLRLDKLLLGRIQFASLRLDEPSLNLVKRSDGTWNVVELVERLSAPRRAPLNLFPAIQVSDGRIDFKFGTRKTMLYISQADLTLYPERSGKLYIQFSGSPARTDRAGNGFGYLHGAVNWYLNRPATDANQVEANVTLDPSNLSELTTLLEGQDIGVHGTVSANARIQGPATALRMSGELRLEDVHRWDLLPMSGEEWLIRYRGDIDLVAHRFDVETVPMNAGAVTPVALHMRVNNFLTRPAWSVFAHLDKVPVRQLLPLGRRMGLAFPPGLAIDGTMDGVVGYSNVSGLGGGVSINNVVASSPTFQPLRAETVQASIFPNRVHLEPAPIETPDSGTLQAGGDYYFNNRRVAASVKVDEFSADSLKKTLDAWFGAPAAFAVVRGGTVTGRFLYSHQETVPSPELPAPPPWSGQFQFVNATLAPEGMASPLRDAQGRIAFDDKALDLTHFSGKLGDQTISGTYHYNALAKRPERVHVEISSADLAQIQAALEPTLQGQGIWARLRVTQRTVPPWLARRSLDGDLLIDQFSVNQTNLGPLSARFTWQGTNLDFTSLRLNLPEGLIRAQGSANLAGYSPRLRFEAKVTGFPWGGGLLNAAGQFQVAGTGADTLKSLRASGTFSGENISLSEDDAFDRISGLFAFSFAENWPSLRLSKIEAFEEGDAWSGQGASQYDGKLTIDLEREGRQLHLINSLMPETVADAPSLTNRAVPQ